MILKTPPKIIPKIQRIILKTIPKTIPKITLNTKIKQTKQIKLKTIPKIKH